MHVGDTLSTYLFLQDTGTVLFPRIKTGQDTHTLHTLCAYCTMVFQESLSVLMGVCLPLVLAEETASEGDYLTQESSSFCPEVLSALRTLSYLTLPSSFFFFFFFLFVVDFVIH